MKKALIIIAVIVVAIIAVLYVMDKNEAPVVEQAQEVAETI